MRVFKHFSELSNIIEKQIYIYGVSYGYMYIYESL